MSPFITEAAAAGLKEGAKLGIIWFVFSSFLSARGKEGLIGPFYAGVALSSVLVLFSFFIPPDAQTREFVSKLIGYVFFLLYLASVGALYQSSGIDIFGPLGPLAKKKNILGFLIAFASAVYFAPDIIGSSMFIREVSEMKGVFGAPYASALLGFVFAAAFFSYVPSRLRGGRLKGWVSGFLDTSQLLLFLSIVKLLGGGIKGFAELSLVPSVTRGAMKFVHDFVHQIFVFLMVPDHPVLKITAWNFVGIFFGSNFGRAVALLLLVLPPVMFLYRNLLMPVPEPAGKMTGAERRAVKAGIRADLRKKAVPAALFAAFILFSWFSAGGQRASALYNPNPKPVVDDKGLVMIPLTDPTMDLRDGRLHKFSLVKGTETVTIDIIKKPDGKLAVCLDACEICPPDGYGQTEGYVVCIYCMTPIPIETLGKPGGCNPIPLEAEVTERDIRINVGEIMGKWQDVKTGKTKEAIR